MYEKFEGMENILLTEKSGIRLNHAITWMLASSLIKWIEVCIEKTHFYLSIFKFFNSIPFLTGYDTFSGFQLCCSMLRSLPMPNRTLFDAEMQSGNDGNDNKL